MADGWNDDDLDLNDDDAWGDDDDFFQQDECFTDDPLETRIETIANRTSTEQRIAHEETAMMAGEGWDDDLDGLDDDDEEEEDEVSSPPYSLPTHNTAMTTLQHDIQHYLEQLERLKPSLNAVLQSLDKAHELMDYYTQRPALRNYTIQKELERMEYMVITEEGDVITDKAEIAVLLQHDSSLVAHCANQSLLADLLQVCTGPDLLVRPQFLAAAVAEQVQFRLDLAAAVVQVHATLSLSLPTDQGRWNVATVQVQVVFGCHPQHAFVEYHVHSIENTIRPESYQSSLDACVRFVASMDLQEDHAPSEQQQQSMATDFRDLFLQQSQAVFTNSATGLKSAWADMDSVTGLSHKLQHIPRFLPEDVVLEAAAASEQQQPVHRPTSILGGFMRTGFTKLAQSVALPEEDPSMYTDVMVSKQPRLVQPNPAAPRVHPLDRLAQGQQPNAPSSVPPNPLDRLTQGQQQRSSHAVPTSVPPNPLDRLTQGQQHPAPSSVPPNPLDRLTQGQQQRSSHAAPSMPPPNPLDRLTQGQQHPSASIVPPNPLDRLTQLRSKPSTESSHSATSLPKDNITNIDDDQEDEVFEDGWDDVDDLDLDDEDVVANTNSSVASSRSPLEDKLPLGFQYNPEDDIIPTRRRWIDPRPGIRIPRPVR